MSFVEISPVRIPVEMALLESVLLGYTDEFWERHRKPALDIFAQRKKLVPHSVYMCFRVLPMMALVTSALPERPVTRADQQELQTQAE
ncbi:MAG TPA: hypothetical protein DCS09_07100 [Porphyromonadaceae bacterium]|nr:hypothetical protein [Porphyromonadaceae bacterium]